MGFLVQEMKPAFTRDKYDTLYHNCNHFSDRLCDWLGCKRLPVDILKQHEQILTTPFARVMWPILNQVLGGSSLVSSKDVNSIRCHSIEKDVDQRLEATDATENP